MTSFALRASVLVGGVLTGFVAQAPEVAAQQSASPPDFSFNHVGWVATGEITGVAGGQPILRQDPAHAYVPNNIGRQPADSGDCGQGFRLIADTDSDRSRTAFR